MSLNTHLFQIMLTAAGLPAPTLEHVFAPPRKWRMDFAWPGQMIALEVEGGVWSGGRHTRGAGFVGDIAKYNAAATRGWRVVRCTPKTLCTEETIEMLGKLLDRDAVATGSDYAARHPGAVVTRLLSAPDLAALADVSLSTTTLWVTRDRLPCFDVMGRPFVDADTLAGWLSHTTALSPAVRARLAAWVETQKAPATKGTP